MATTESDVLWMLDLIAAIGTSPVIAGGWGVDALVGSATREHRDLDVLVPEPHVDELVEALRRHGFDVTTDWLPIRVELTDRANDRHIDLHPAHDDGAGGYWQHGFGDDRFESPSSAITDGVIAGRAVRCFTIGRQLELHAGYELAEPDLADIDTLRRLRRAVVQDV